MDADARRFGWRWLIAAVHPDGDVQMLDPDKARREIRLSDDAIIKNVLVWPGSPGVLGTRSDGSIENDSAVTPLIVNCPIVRDHTVTTDAWSIDVRVHDKSPTTGVVCVATSLFGHAQFVEDDDAQTNNMDQGLATLTMSPPLQGDDGHSVLKCTIPPASAAGGRSRLLAYVVREPDGAPGDWTDTKNYTGTYAEIFVPTAGVAPFINYPDLGLAKPASAPANDKWVLPIIRDNTMSKWERVRLLAQDSDADLLLNCLVFNMNENGTTNGLGATGTQSSTGNTEVKVEYHINNGDHTGPIAIQCDRLQSDITATRYDIREWYDDIPG